MLKCSRATKSGGANKQERLIQSATDYLEKLYQLESKVGQSLLELRQHPSPSLTDLVKMDEIDQYKELLIKHIDLITRRLLKGENIPHGEKLFSIFEQHTEWIKKGKLRPNVELGHRLLITSNQHGFIVDYKIMDHTADSEEVEPLLERLSSSTGFENIESISFDKGFSSKANKERVKKVIPLVVMPKKGKLSKVEVAEQANKKWKQLRHAHSAVESDINCLEHHGLDRCPDKGYSGYKRYVGLGVLAYNLHKIGNALQGEVRGKAKRKRAA